MKKSLLSLCLLIAVLTSKAQEQKGSISGTLIDSTTNKTIAYATVSVYSTTDTTLIGYKLSDEKGTFRIAQIPLNTTYRYVVTFMGYSITRNSFELTPNRPNLNVGNIFLKPTVQDINEIIIRAERPPVMIRKDTIEFNAAAFKTLPDALVEDLLRKLPGVTVDKDGNILVNGKRVNTMYVDGKDFFGGDIRIASKNLPANTIDKIEVTPDQEVLKANPLMHEADIPLAINLKLKPGIKKGIFGKIYAGGGVQEKHEAGALLNLFRDTTQVSILAYSNNLNKAAFNFTDIRSVGGFNRSSWGNANGNGNGGLSIDKVSFGGFGSGLMKSTGGGGNFNTIINKKVQLGLNYFYGAVDSEYDELRNNTQTFNNDLLNTRQTMRQLGDNDAHLISSKVVFNITPKLTLDIKPQLVLFNDKMNQHFLINSSSENAGPLNTSTNIQENLTDNTTFHLWTRLTPQFTKPGRSLSISSSSVLDRSRIKLFNNVENVFFQPSSISKLDQLRDNYRQNDQIFNFSSFTEPLNNRFTLNAGIVHQYNTNINDIDTYFSDVNGQYVIPIDYLTESYTRKRHKIDANMAIRWKKNKYAVNVGITTSNFNAKNTFSKSAPINQNYYFLLPSAEISYDILRLSYQTFYTEPAIANLQPLTDNTNPLFLRTGNPNLKPSYTNGLNLNIRKYDVKKSLTYNAGISSSFINNATIISRTIDATGVQRTFPINANGSWNAGNSLSLQKDWKLENNKQISLVASNNLSFYHSFVMVNGEKSNLESFSVRPSGEVRMNLNDKFEFNQSYSFSSANNSYKSTLFEDQKLIFHDSKSEIIIRPTQKIVLESTIDYRYNSNSIPGLLKDYYKWNAAISYLFLKGNRGQLKLAVNDILDQNIIANRVIRENYIEDMQGSTIRRHGLLTFTYNIRNFGGKIGGRNSLF